MSADVVSVLQMGLLALLVLATTAVLSLLQIVKWVLIGKGLLERREDTPHE